MKLFIAFTLLVVTTSAELILPTEQIKDNEEFKYTLQDNQEKPADAPTQIKIETTPNPDPLAPASASGAQQARQQREIILGTHTSPLLVQSVLPRYVLFDQQQLPVYPFYILPYRNLEQQQQQQPQQQPQQKN